MAELKPLAVQLYSLRDALEQDFNRVIEKLADIGYIGVEPYGGLPVSPKEAKQQFDAHNLKVESAHIGIPQGKDKEKVLDTAHAFGVEYVIVPYLPPENFDSPDAVKATAELLNEADVIARDAGFTLCYHNHWWEFGELDGRVVMDRLLDHLEPTVQLQIDTYWVTVAGQNVIDYIEKLGARAPLLHIKDGPGNYEDPMVAVGEGIMNFHEIIPASELHTKWLCTELDRCATDMMTAIEKSYQYLTKEGLGRGRNS